jgi:hypothetical protein
MAVEASTAIASGQAAVTGAIRNAAQATGTSFSYLLATARIESGLNPNVTMKSSSATGLFQFIDQTWLGTLKQAGPAFGYGDYAKAISRTSSGRYVVQDPRMRDAIMKLRKDPTANAVMAGIFTQQNTASLTKRLGRQPSDGELYMAHFFGAGGAGKLIALAGNNPQASAADLFPAAARANKPIFYDRQGQARSVAGVYAELVRRYQVASGGASTATASAVLLPPVGIPRPPAGVASRPAADTAGITNAFAVASGPAVGASSTDNAPSVANALSPPLFDSLFSDERRRSAVAPGITQLWSMPAGSSPAVIDGAISPTSPDKAGTGARPLDLFQDAQPNARAIFGGSA